jgi:hypothetical protein
LAPLPFPVLSSWFSSSDINFTFSARSCCITIYGQKQLYFNYCTEEWIFFLLD